MLLAAIEGHAEMVRLLVAAGADTKLTTQNGTTVLMGAARSGNLSTIQAAYELAGNIYARNRMGQNVVHLAVLAPLQSPFEQILQFLASKGAQLNVKDAHGRTPMDICTLRTFDNARELLRKLIAEQKNQ